MVPPAIAECIAEGAEGRAMVCLSGLRQEVNERTEEQGLFFVCRHRFDGEAQCHHLSAAARLVGDGSGASVVVNQRCECAFARGVEDVKRLRFVVISVRHLAEMKLCAKPLDGGKAVCRERSARHIFKYVFCKFAVHLVL